MFLALFIIGLIGLLFMALPGIAHMGAIGHGHAGIGGAHGHIGGAHGHIAGGNGHAGASHGQPAATHGAGTHSSDQGTGSLSPGKIAGSHVPASPLGRLASLIPSPRAVFSCLTLYGAFGQILSRSIPAALVIPLAIAGALAVENLAVKPLWNAMMGFEGKPSSAMEDLMLTEAEAATNFRNGRGMATVVRDGRAVQLVAQITGEHGDTPVRVGDKLVVEDVDSARERITVRLR